MNNNPATKGQILVIDDDRSLTSLLDKTLRAKGYDVLVAGDGKAGLALWLEHDPQLIILDIKMPEMDGFTFVQEFKRLNGDIRQTPIIVLTAKEEMRDIFALEGINDYIVKPFQMEFLLKKIAVHLSNPVPNVLVIDDSSEVIDLVQEGLTSRGYDVTTAEDGVSGLDLAKRKRPDVIVLDVMIPKLSGLIVCRMLKFDVKFKDISVILLSALGEEKDRQMGVQVGCDAYLSKPLSGDTLLRTMKELVWD